MKLKVLTFTLALFLFIGTMPLNALATNSTPFTLEAPNNLTVELKFDQNNWPYFAITMDVPESVQSINKNLNENAQYYSGTNCSPIKIRIESKYRNYDWNQGPSLYNITEMSLDDLLEGNAFAYYPYEEKDAHGGINLKAEVYHFRAHFYSSWGYVDSFIDKKATSNYSDLVTLGNPALYCSSIGSASAYTGFKETMLEIKKLGDDYTENGMKLQAQYYYGMAGSSVSAMRLAVDHILDMKGESKYLKDVEDTNVTAKLIYKDWESIAAISPASPYPYYFEGLIYHIQGNESKAKEAYQNALINPLFSEKSTAFYYLNELSIDELSKMRDELAVIESDLYEFFTPRPYGLERHPMNYNDEYLRAKAKDVLEKEENEYSEALRYYTAALRVNPFDAKNYACCALISIFNNDVDAAITCVNEGLWVDENNKELNQIAAWLTQN